MEEHRSTTNPQDLNMQGPNETSEGKTLDWDMESTASTLGGSGKDSKQIEAPVETLSILEDKSSNTVGSNSDTTKTKSKKKKRLFPKSWRKMMSNKVGA